MSDEYSSFMTKVNEIKLNSGDSIRYIEGLTQDGRRTAKVFCYGYDATCNGYLEVTEAEPYEGLLDTNAKDGREFVRADAEEASEIVERLVDGDYVDLDISYDAYLVDGFDYSEDLWERGWNWLDDIVIVEDRHFNDDELADCYYMAAKASVEQQGYDEFGVDLNAPDADRQISDAIEAELADFSLHLWSIEENSKLYQFLTEWYGLKGLDMDKTVRCGFHAGGYLFFATGGNYAKFDADLLGGDLRGTAQNEFKAYIDSKMR